MIRIDGNYWVDENNNRWSCNLNTEEEALIKSESLIFCRWCIDCTHCIDCVSCTECENCKDCKHCEGCKNCRRCICCKCCKHCTLCTGCTYCTYCNYCRDCRNYKEPPLMYKTKMIGSRNDNTIFYYDGVSNLQVVCGCFRGNLQEFEKQVKKTHGDNEFARQYMKEIKKVKFLFELED